MAKKIEKRYQKTGPERTLLAICGLAIAACLLVIAIMTNWLTLVPFSLAHPLLAILIAIAFFVNRTPRIVVWLVIILGLLGASSATWLVALVIAASQGSW